MKKLMTLLFLFPFSLQVIAQDLQEADSTPPAQESIVVGRYNAGMVEVSADALKSASPESKARIALDFGFSYRIAKMVEGLNSYEEDFLRKMRSGFLYGGDIHGFFPFGLGLGARFAGHHYRNTEWGTKGMVDTYYVAPSMMWRSFTRKSDVFYYGLSIGYLSFSEKRTEDGRSMYSISKGGVGTTFDIGYDIRTSGNTFLGFKLTITGGTIVLGEDNSGNKVGESLSAIDLSAGLRF